MVAHSLDSPFKAGFRSHHPKPATSEILSLQLKFFAFDRFAGDMPPGKAEIGIRYLTENLCVPHGSPPSEYP